MALRTVSGIQREVARERAREEEGDAPAGLAASIEALRGRGATLPASEREFYEPRFKRDFGEVKVHTGAEAGELAQQVNARAFTVGSDIVFASGEYAPGTPEGRRLMAHELTHVVQQSGDSTSATAGPTTLQRVPGSSRWGPFRIDGDDAFVGTVREHLNQLNATSQGGLLIQVLTRTRRGLVYRPIKIEPGPANTCGYFPTGSGTHSGAITYNPHGCVRGNACPDRGDPNWPSVPMKVYLHHELTHAYIDQVLGRAYDDERECMATGLGRHFREIRFNENRLRCELGLPIRPCYSAECRDHAAPDCQSVPAEITREEWGRRFRSRQPPGGQRRDVVEQLRRQTVQPKLRVDRSDSPAEQEADRVADAVTTGSGAPGLVANGAAPAALVQRMPIGEAIGTTLGRLSFRAPESSPAEGELRLEREIVPAGQTPGRFAGFASRVEALVHAWRADTLAAVGTDGEGRFHVLDTGWPHAPPGLEMRIVPYQDIPFPRLWWVSPTSEAAGGDRSWALRVSRAKAQWNDWRAGRTPEGFHSLAEARRHLERVFASLLQEALGISGALVHVAQSRTDRDPTAINFDLEMAEAEGRGGIARLPADPGEPIPTPTLTIGPEAFDPESRLHLRGTAVHEATHFAHASGSVALMERWRSRGSPGTFAGWLAAEERAGRISTAEYELAMELAGGSSWASTETLSRLEAFMTVYHHLPITETIARFGQLDLMGRYWRRSRPDAQRTSMRRLAEYVRGLDPEHRRDFAEHARGRRDSVRGADFEAFWNRVVREAVGE